MNTISKLSVGPVIYGHILSYYLCFTSDLCSLIFFLSIYLFNVGGMVHMYLVMLMISFYHVGSRDEIQDFKLRDQPFLLAEPPLQPRVMSFLDCVFKKHTVN